MSAAALLASAPLFDGVPPDERDHLARLMRAFAVDSAAELFHEGDEADRMYLIEEGRLRAHRCGVGAEQVELGVVGPGAVVGEMSLLGTGIRTATVSALEEARGWALDRAAFDVLRADLRPGSLVLMRRIGALAVDRLRERYTAVAGRLGGDAPPQAPPAGALEEVTPEPGEAGYLAGTLFFSRVEPGEVAPLVDGLRRLHAPRGALLFGSGEAPGALYIVGRGAIETTIRRGGVSRRVRLAGPGRAVGHLGVLGLEPGIIECRARERSILLEVPWARVGALLAGEGPGAQGFTAGFDEDVVRALLEAERPSPRMVAPAAA